MRRGRRPPPRTGSILPAGGDFPAGPGDQPRHRADVEAGVQEMDRARGEEHGGSPPAEAVDLLVVGAIDGPRPPLPSPPGRHLPRGTGGHATAWTRRTGSTRRNSERPNGTGGRAVPVRGRAAGRATSRASPRS